MNVMNITNPLPLLNRITRCEKYPKLCLYLKLITTYLGAFFLYGCSVVAYTPVVVTSVLGINKTDLSEKQEFIEFTNRPFHLQRIDEKSWQLKKFEGGRYHIELSVGFSKKEVICELNDETVVIDKIFDDSLNGGIFYTAKVNCNGHNYTAPLNNWSAQLRDSIKFIGNNTY
jgi:hypothetical protein